jgi:small subunit ribosomal protein S4
MRPIKEKRERALGTKLFLKGDRCNSPKCVMVRKPYRPGQHGQRRTNVTEYGRQLQEKQKVQIYFGLSTRQMQKLFSNPSPERIRQTLEHRLDQVLVALAFAKSTRIARQMISHGHIHVNGRKVTIASFSVSVGDVVSIRPESQSSKLFEGLAERLKKHEAPAWLKLDAEKFSGRCVALSTAHPGTFPFDITIVGQFFAR